MANRTWASTIFVCQSELLRSGWSLGLIAGLLGPVDRSATNPCCARWASAKLWYRDRVIEAERSDDWQAHHSGQRLRRQSAKQNEQRRAGCHLRGAYLKVKWGD